MSSFALDQVTVASPAQFAASMLKATPKPLRETVVLAYLHNDGCQHVETFPVTADWVEIVEAVQNTISVNTYEQVIICVYTERGQDELPFRAQVKDLTSVIGDDIHVLDELLIDSNRYWSYMCSGCCDPEGNVFKAEPNNQITLDYTLEPISDALVTQAEEKVSENMGVNSVRAWELLEEIVSNPDQADMAEFIALVQDVNVRDYVLIHVIQSESIPPLVQTLVNVTLQTPEPQQYLLAGMTAMALQGTYAPVMAVSEMLKLSGDNSLGRLVQRAVDHDVPQSVARDSLEAAADEVMDKVKTALEAVETAGYIKDIEASESGSELRCEPLNISVEAAL